LRLGEGSPEDHQLVQFAGGRAGAINSVAGAWVGQVRGADTFPEYSGELAGITAAFRSLPVADRELIALAAWEGLDTGQIVAVLGRSANAVRIRRHRARRQFAPSLNQFTIRRSTTVMAVCISPGCR
jgi:DNA-directed RNA polymerase specialized sigma24 family protein